MAQIGVANSLLLLNHLSTTIQTARFAKLFSTSYSKNMKLIQFYYKESPKELRVGYLQDGNVVDVNKIDQSLPKCLIEVLKSALFEKVKKLAATKQSTTPIESVCLAAPITGMDKVICVGLNYKDHCEEQNIAVPKVPMFFSKFPSTIIGPNDAVRLRTDITNKVDWEVELAIVIGQTASNIKEDEVYDHVLGYTIAQDISARDWQKERNAGQFLLGKSMDTFAPIGPCIVTSDEIPDPQVLDIECSINGVLKQKSNTNQLAHKIPFLIARLSSVMTLFPGDIILTGTPGGVGMYRSPPEYLQPGDCIESKIQCIGVLNTRVEKF